MLTRRPVAAGRFYPGGSEDLKKEVDGWLEAGAKARKEEDGKHPWAFMLPHAGYIFCGGVLGKTLAGRKLAPRQIILCPNHTGQGVPLSVWPEGEWLTPLGDVKVDSNLASAILASGGGFQPDAMAHIGEHSIEVVLPFLQDIQKELSIVPICVGVQNPQMLERAGNALASVLKKPENADVGLVISSDMNHYESEKRTIAKDELALAQACAASPEGLLRVVGMENISMCGAGPLALALYAARALGGVDVELVAHDTSASASGDYDHTVGYAGLRLYLKAS